MLSITANRSRKIGAQSNGLTRLTVLAQPGRRLGAEMTDRGRQDLLEVIDDRVHCASVLITYQLPTKAWHDYLGEPTIADAVLDRILHNKHAIELTGDSMRRKVVGREAKD